MVNTNPKTVSELPNESFFAIITESSEYVEGDERSKTHPGHGYPAYTLRYLNMEVFPNRTAWEKEIKRLSAFKQPSNFKAVYITPAVVKTEVSVNISVGD